VNAKIRKDESFNFYQIIGESSIDLDPGCAFYEAFSTPRQRRFCIGTTGLR
jgi:hypothetical protein